ncbi:MAG: dihydropteroate synthase [Phycisphaerales bacterium]
MNAWNLGSRPLPLDRPRIVAILNVTPDSFADGGRALDPGVAIDRAFALAAEGADALDIGGESTRPGSQAVPAQEQSARVLPVLRGLRARAFPLPITIDTTLAPVAAAALDAGADGINDISAGRDDPAMLELVASRGAGLILMHRLTAPPLDRFSDRYAAPPVYGDVVAEVAGFLRERAAAAVAAGIEPQRLVLDPGLGFGKDVAQNLALIDGTRVLRELGFPMLSGLSRKSFVGRVWFGRDSTPDERLEGTIAMSVRHLHAGAVLFRVHDVAAHRAALDREWAQFSR